jgi:hypothetical protein
MFFSQGKAKWRNKKKSITHFHGDPPPFYPPNRQEVLHTRSTSSEDKWRCERNEARAISDTVWKRFKNDSPSRLGGWHWWSASDLYGMRGGGGERQDHVTAGTEDGIKSVGDVGSSFNSRYDVQLIQVDFLTHNFFYNMFIWILYMFRAGLCSSSGGQLYWYNIWYNYCVIVAVWYAGQEVVPYCPAYRMATNTEWLYQKLY